MSRIALLLLLLCHPPSTQVRDSEAGRGKVLRKRHGFRIVRIPRCREVNDFWWREINSDDAAARVVALDSTPGADRWQGGTGGKTERTHMALLELQKATGLAGWAPGFACRTDHHAAYPHFPWALPRTSISPQSPFLVAGLILLSTQPSLESLPSLPVCDFFDTSEPLVRTRLISEIAALQQRPV